jgi:hypothetical protein
MNLDSFLNIFENIVHNNNIINYILQKNNKSKVMPLFDSICEDNKNKYENKNEDENEYENKYHYENKYENNYEIKYKNNYEKKILQLKVMNNNNLNNYFYDEYNYDIETGLYDIEIGHKSLENSKF